jgi:hypothetical protein
MLLTLLCGHDNPGIGFAVQTNPKYANLDSYWNDDDFDDEVQSVKAMMTALLNSPPEDEEEGVEKTKPEPATLEAFSQWASKFSKPIWTMVKVNEGGIEEDFGHSCVYGDSLAKITEEQHCIVEPINVWC